MPVVAKFKVQSILSMHGGGTPLRTVSLAPVSGPGNEEWSQYTPSGRIEMTITNPEAAKQFELGKDVLVTFCPVEE